jgi:hypothetical protein
MVDKPVPEKIHDLDNACVRRVAFKFLLESEDAFRHILMLFLVGSGVGISSLREKEFLALKMLDRISDQSVEYPAHGIFALSVGDAVEQFIDHDDHLFVIVVKNTDADAHGRVIPSHKWHNVLARLSLK